MQLQVAAALAVFLSAFSFNPTNSAAQSVVQEMAMEAENAERRAEAVKARAEKNDDSEEKASTSEKPLAEKTTATGYAANPHGAIISKHARAHGVPEALAHAVVRVESNFRASATGAAGEIGLMQLKLATARMVGYTGSAKALYDPETNIKYGMKYLAMAQSLGDGSTCGTILKYNAGHAAKSMNPISRNYCNKVAGML